METNIYKEYIKEIEERKGQGLHPKPIDSAELLKEIVAQIKDVTNENRQDSLSFFIYKT
jgi:aconitate hydratase 2/2-methylisocitrate dehydratase